jgi:hypothetical protein
MLGKLLSKKGCKPIPHGDVARIQQLAARRRSDSIVQHLNGLQTLESHLKAIEI